MSKREWFEIEDEIGNEERARKDAMFMARVRMEVNQDASHWIAKAREHNRAKVALLRELAKCRTVTDWTRYNYGAHIDRYGFEF